MTSTAQAISPDSGTHWTEPGAWLVAPGVHRIPLPLPMDGLRAVNVYVVEADDGLTLIDGGWAIEVARTLLETSLHGIGFDVRDIRRFLVTHVHRDHYTQAVTIRREFGSHVSLGLGDKATLDLIHAGAQGGQDPHVEMFVAAGAADIARQWEDFTRNHTADLSLWDYPDEWLEGDSTLTVGDRTIDAVHTPGHTQGHYVFADRPSGLLFAGDHVLPTITPSIGFEPVLADQPLGDFMASLTKVRGLPDLMLLPAHGPVAPSAHARIDELLAHHETRLGLCVAVLDGNASSSAFDIAGALPWTRHEHALKDLDVFNAALATLETRAHLELLVARGTLTRGHVDGVVLYSA
ncbi:MBL fold metallo-hydrolase [Nocardioides sp.]|uniref:MBL fold metallo-hydrolase n=1 Tax=Nocardioides sp. TaxID=35761 RepID=UPI00262C2879|nr:MBL fold metallo-hydrolase [Nocardioides sp.]